MKYEPRIVYGGPDDRLFAELRRSLEPRGCGIKWVAAPQGLPTHRPGDDDWILILDADLRTPEGSDVLRLFKKAHPATPVVFVTRHKCLTNLAMACSEGAHAIFFKPFTDLSPILERVDAALARLDMWTRVLDHAQRIQDSNQLAAAGSASTRS